MRPYRLVTMCSALAATLLAFIAAICLRAETARAAAPPRLLSQTGIFRDLASLTPATGAVPYELNVPFSSDMAVTRRWILLPGDGTSADPTEDRIITKPGLPWAFPTGTVFIRHLDWVPDEARPAQLRRLETQLLVRDNQGAVYGLTYRWNAQGTDAEASSTAAVEELTVKRADGRTEQQPWDFLTPDQCLVCHNQAAGGVLGANYRQINRPIRYGNHAAVNQFAAWNGIAMVSKSLDEPKALDIWNLSNVLPSLPIPFWSIARTGRLARSDDPDSSLEDRARSYLDANCSHCHAPGIVNADFDARSTTPTDRQGFIGARARIPRVGVEYLVKPGAPEESLVYRRVHTIDPALRMPPLGRNAIDAGGARLLADWIRSLAPVDGRSSTAR